MKINFRLSAFVLAFSGLLLAACGGGKGDPGPGPGPSPVPTTGTINIVYQRPAGMTCLSAGTDFYRCSGSVRVTGDPVGWPAGIRPNGLQMTDNNGMFIASAEAPSTPPPARLRIYVIDPWLCPPTSVCSVITGRGITINGTRLKDADQMAEFSFIPPTAIP